MSEVTLNKQDLYQLLKDEKFLSLENKLNTFNIFNALGIETDENRHSSFLAFLLNPRESHQLGDLFLKEFLQAAFPSRTVEFSTRNFMDVIVRTEFFCSSRTKNRLDILIKDSSASTIYAIEHKIKSKESKHGTYSTQLKFYKDCLQKNRTTKNIQKKNYIFLTPDGTEPSDKEWVSLSYTDIEHIIVRILNFYPHKLLPEFKTILQQYLDTIRRSILMSDNELDGLCQKIYQLHQKTIDYISSKADDPVPHALSLIKTILESRSDLFEINSSRKWIFCSLKKFYQYESLRKPATEKDTVYKKSYVGLFIKLDGDTLIMQSVLGPTDKQRSFRRKLQKYFIQNRYTKRKTQTEKYHAVSSELLLSKKDISDLFENNEVEKSMKEDIKRKILSRYEIFEEHLKKAIVACHKKEK